MPFRALIGLLVPLLFSLHAWADNIQLNPGHPTRYTVVKGDTLWDISGKFLQKPWQWPQIWHNNPQIENPHLIYPGDVITLTIVDGQPRLSVSRNNGVLKLSPHIRETEHQDAIKVIPIDAIAAYLTSPKVVGKDDLDNAPYIIDFAGEYLVAAAGDRVYVRSITEPKHLAYTIYRQGETYKNPETGEILGYEAKYIADTTLQRPGDPATLLITKSKSEIRIGDRLMPNQEGQVALNYFPRAPKSMISGSIISVLNGVSQIGRHDIVIVDKGSRDGLKAGHVLDIYQRGDIVRDKYSGIVNETVTLPEELAGTLMIFRTFDRVSYALVMEATAAIHVLDKIKTPLNTSNEQDPKYWLALLRTPGVGPRTFLRILAVCTPEQLFTQARHLPDELNLTRRSIDFIKNPDWRSIDQDLNWLAQPDNHLLTCDDPAYPKQLQEIPDAPPVLFVRGSIDLLSRPQIAIVGSHNPSSQGKQTAQDFAGTLAACGFVITSGLALGIDAASHIGALRSGGLTIAVAGTGLDRIYPARHKQLALEIVENGAIISEFPPSTTAKAGHFPRRNRIISGLCIGLLVVEAARQSGSLITARLALEQNREVFAIPGSIHNPLARGCNALIREGAKLVETTRDILEEFCQYNQQPEEKEPHQEQSMLDLEQQKLLNLTMYSPTSCRHAGQ